MKFDTYKIEKARVLRGWSKRRLAQVAGIDPATVGRVERGVNLKPETVKKIADVLGIEMTDLVNDTAA